MTPKGPLDLVVEVAALLEELAVPYALGGSLASSLIGEPRSTMDIDIAVSLDPSIGEVLLRRVGAEFYVPVTSARAAIRAKSSFNLVDTEHSLKVDLFVLGDSLLDRRQLERRVEIDLAGGQVRIWVTSAEDQVLRKLDWYRRSGGSERQWRDVVGILRVSSESIDHGDLHSTAEELGLGSLLGEAWRQARGQKC
jgi:hypothetical protein